ncbi:tetratricopeptide repeat protein 16 isoform X3 [Channa argus]|uniref:tetratricopeptide repeat protein 16 isoform X3 n=1 Tax=Channa argus TaxID=215402 RepID=UPI003521273D
MDTSEGSNAQTQAKEHNLFPSAVSKEEPDEAERKSPLKQLFGSSKIFVAQGEKCHEKPDLRGSHIIQRKVAEHFTNGKEAMEKSHYDKAVICFSKAITLQPEQIQLHAIQGEAYLQLCDFQSAAECYKRAWLLEPGAFKDRLAFTYYVQGQCLFDRGLYKDALEVFSKAADVKPGCRAYAVRRLTCLTAVGHHTECLKIVNEWMASDSPSSDLYVLRARLHKKLNQTSRCYQDVKSAVALKPTCPEAGALLLQLQEASEEARQRAVDRALTGQLPEALCMINIALENCPEDGRLYLFRGTLYRQLKDFTAAIEDLVQAVELSEKARGVRGQAEDRDERNDHGSLQEEVEFQLVLTYNDFAVQCFGRGLYAEAILLLNKAIEEEKGQTGLYLNRGADYQQAEEMQPEDPAVRLRLAVLHNTMGSVCFQAGRFHEAADMFSQAIHYNPTASQYYENRSKASRKVLNLEGARQDFICTLILDPTNEELPPMLMSLFPGCSMSEVLSSPAGQAARVQLMDSIEAFNSSSDQQRLNEKLQKMTLTDQKIAAHSQDSSEAGKDLTCKNQQEMQIIVKDLLQVLTGDSRRITSHTVWDKESRSVVSPRMFSCAPHWATLTIPKHTVEQDQATCRHEGKSYNTRRFGIGFHVSEVKEGSHWAYY